MIFSFTTNAFAYVFRDLSESRKEVEEVTDLGFIFYSSVPFFEPETIVNRYVAAETMYVLANGNLMVKAHEVPMFPDTQFNQFVFNFAKQSGIVDGIVGSIFKPSAPAKYGEVVKMLVRTLNLGDNIHIEIEHLAKQEEYIETAKQLGLLDNVMRERDDFVTHEELAILIHNAVNAKLTEDRFTIKESRFEHFETMSEGVREFERIMTSARMSSQLTVDELEGKLEFIEQLKQLEYLNENAYSKQMLRFREQEDFKHLLDVYKGYMANFENLQNEGYVASSWDLYMMESYIEMFLRGEEREFNNEIANNLEKALFERLYERAMRDREILESKLPTERILEEQVENLEKLLSESIQAIAGYKEMINGEFSYTQLLQDELAVKFELLQNSLEYLSEQSAVANRNHEKVLELNFLLANLSSMLEIVNIHNLSSQFPDEFILSREDLEILKSHFVSEFSEMKFRFYEEESKLLLEAVIEFIEGVL